MEQALTFSSPAFEAAFVADLGRKGHRGSLGLRLVLALNWLMFLARILVSSYGRWNLRYALLAAVHIGETARVAGQAAWLYGNRQFVVHEAAKSQLALEHLVGVMVMQILITEGDIGGILTVPWTTTAAVVSNMVFDRIRLVVMLRLLGIGAVSFGMSMVRYLDTAAHPWALALSSTVSFLVAAAALLLLAAAWELRARAAFLSEQRARHPEMRLPQLGWAWGTIGSLLRPNMRWRRRLPAALAPWQSAVAVCGVLP